MSMGIVKRLSSLFQPAGSTRELWIFVQCDQCGEKLHNRVDLFNDLSIQFGEGEAGTSYYCRKVIIGGNRCYVPITVKLSFNANRKLIDQEITGGKFLTEEEYFAEDDR
jgi:hypothetical protein